MPTVIECPDCGVSLRLRNLEVLKKGLACPKCKQQLPTTWPPEDELLDLADIEVVEEDDSAAEDDFDDEEPARSPRERALLTLQSPGISFREYMRTNRNPIILMIACLVKVLKIPMPVSSDDPPVISLEPFETGFDDFAESARSDIEATVLELKELGFRNPLLHRISHPDTRTEYHLVTVRHASGEAIARLEHRHWRGINPSQTKLFCSLITSMDDGRLLVTTNQAPELNGPDSIDVQRQRDARPADLWTKHQSRVAAESGAALADRISDKDGARELLERHHRTVCGFHLGRGMFAQEPGSRGSQAARGRTASPSAAAKRRQPAAAASAAASARVSASAADTSAAASDWDSYDSGDRHSGVLEQIEKQQGGESSWKAGIVLAVISAAFFLGLGAFQWDWRTVLIILPVLFVHELGHYVAMKIFGYRNLKMFFIPLFGAAVTGRNYNVAGWQKVVVSLAGPVPGIALGILIGIWALRSGSDLGMQVAILTLLLNGLNLLPVLPLDGGWVAHSLFFSRHYAIDVAFRVITALVLLGISLAIGDLFLIFLGVAMLVAIPTVLRTGRIVHRLKDELSTASVDEQTIPTDTAERIIDEIEEDFPPTGLNDKLKAQMTLNIFQSLNTAAPGILGTLFLSAIHGGSMFCALVMMIVLVIGKHTGFNELMSVAASAPETPYECGTTGFVEGEVAAALTAESEVCVVATCTDAESAASLMQEVSGEVPENGALRLFGPTLLLMLPDEAEELRNSWIDRLETGGAEVVVRSDTFSVPLAIQFISRNEQHANEIHESLQLYFRAQQIRPALIPPWSPDHTLTDEHTKARSTLWKLQGFGDAPDGSTPEDAEAEEAEDPGDRRQNQLMERIGRARQTGNRGMVRRLQQELDALREEQEQQRIDGIRSLGPDVVVPEMIDLYVQRPVYDFTEIENASEDEQNAAWERHSEALQRWQNGLGEYLGQLPLDDGEPSPQDTRYSANSAYMERAGLIHQISYLRLTREVDGIAALTEWLCDQGCVDIRYRFGDLLTEF